MTEEEQLLLDLAVYGTAAWVERADGTKVRVDPRHVVSSGLDEWLDWNDK